MMRWIRKGSLIASSIAAALLALFLFAFKDPLFKFGLKRAAQSAAGAKVEIGSVTTFLLEGRVVLKNAAIADKNDPMRNLLEFDEAVLQFNPRSALRAKIVISRAGVTGLRFGTSRRKSGALLSRRPLTTLERAIQKELASAGPAAIDADSLSKRLLGPQAARKLSTALYWIAWAKRHGAVTADFGLSEAPELRRGVNVEFPLDNTTPQFLLKDAELEGAIDSPLQDRPMALTGRLTNVNSNPPLYGKPTDLNIKASSGQDGPAMELEGRLDRTKRPGSAELSFHLDRMPLDGVLLGDAELGAAALAGTGRASGTLRINGDQWKGAVLIEAEGLELEPKAGFTERGAAALKRMRRFTAEISFEGKEKDLRFRINSDLGRILAPSLSRP